MIYTSYFSKLKSLPDDILPISICGKAPDWYTGLQYKKLAPMYGFFMEWKKNHDNNFYIRHFNDEVLNTLNINQVLTDLVNMSKLNPNKKYNHICLICYENPNDFCHRHLVAEWIRSFGYKCEEYCFAA